MEDKRDRRKFLYFPEATNDSFVMRIGDSDEAVPEPEPPPPVPGIYPCPCCGFKTFPVPREEALAYICPVCMWENDLFTESDDEPSDENGGLTLYQGQDNYRRYGAVLPRLVQYTRPPLPEELL